ncbi:hypothetical protein B0J13DRAFT_636504 [Dactylonectria estremocensis]|uniref:Uncharacterized protein n=1 Tax=Dactylonectria estremocensis TaxID=1079267 RepID=A0A9P9J597_9HYPO|nr:hypothetical protein B0J13DRAFT_636504 [Dactylonectria estremocensis]
MNVGVNRVDVDVRTIEAVLFNDIHVRLDLHVVGCVFPSRVARDAIDKVLFSIEGRAKGPGSGVGQWEGKRGSFPGSSTMSPGPASKSESVIEIENLTDQFRRLDARNRENLALAGLGIRTSAAIFEAAQKQYEEARGERNPAWRGTVDASALAGLCIRTSANILEATEREYDPAKVDRRSRRRQSQKPGAVSEGQIASEAEDAAEPEGRVNPVGPSHQPEWKRADPGSIGQLALKHNRTVVR